MSPRKGPTRRQKRWSGRLRTSGALLALLGAVGVADTLVGLAGSQSALEPLSRTRLPLALVSAMTAAGVLLYGLGRRWK